MWSFSESIESVELPQVSIVRLYTYFRFHMGLFLESLFKSVKASALRSIWKLPTIPAPEAAEVAL